MFSRRATLLASLAIVALVVVMCADVALAGSKTVPPNSRRFGSLSELSGMWWQWALSIPAADNPILDLTGEKCGEGQLGKVWRLAGTFGVPADRSCTVPASKAILFPVLNAECSEVEGNGSTEEELRACAEFLIDFVTVTKATVDGIPLSPKEIQRVQSPLFSFLLPEDNILGIVDPVPNPSPSVSDGFWVLLKPLSVGEHVISFRGVAVFPPFTFGPGQTENFLFETDVTYNLTVLDDN